MSSEHIGSIAIIGLSGRFPGAKTVKQFWSNLTNGVEGISRLSDEDLDTAGISPDIYEQNNYVKAYPALADIDQFDAEFFNIPPKDASQLDPQRRIFMEIVWEALEDAGYTAADNNFIGVYAGCGTSGYWTFHPDATRPMQSLENELATDKDYLSTFVSYKLNLTGPSMTVQTACSTSLVATSLACQGLLTYQCDLALAGGVTIRVPQAGYLYIPGGLESSDGHCRAFDANARGTVFGNGAGVVVLKRLEDALDDGDHIYAVIRGSAMNNDGVDKIGYTAPSQSGQTEVIEMAHHIAEVSADTISYIETHGTGTPLGDPIEIAALTNAFRASTDKAQYCAIGSAKSSVGHLDAASGVTGLIKTALALKHKQMPPSINFERPNPNIDFDTSPFYVNTTLREWESNGMPRRAGISSFGIGGTNVHMVLEEAPANEPLMADETGGEQATQKATPYLLTLSGKTDAALDNQITQYIDYLEQNAPSNLADICYTANTGRVHFAHRLAVTARDVDALCAKLYDQQNGDVVQGLSVGQAKTEKPKVAFLFPGQGPQYPEMGRVLYETQPLFREIMDESDRILQAVWGQSLLSILYGEDREQSAAILNEATYAQPALFAIEYALAKLWQSWGVEPDVVIGHSMGEYAAACFAGVFSLADGLRLIAERGRLMQTEAEAGQMVAVLASAEEVAPVIAPFADEVSIGVINTPKNVVISGRPQGIQHAVDALHNAGLETRQLKIFVASHSPLMDDILDRFSEVLATVEFQQPHLRVISNVTGQAVAVELTSIDYWRQHLRHSVRFAQGMATLAEMGVDTLIEVGPKPTLLGLGQQCLPDAVTRLWLPSLYPNEQPDDQQMQQSLGEFHVRGGDVDWDAFHSIHLGQRVSLPTYPFQRKRYWRERSNTRFQPGKEPHPLLGERLPPLATSREIGFQNQISAHHPSYLNEHRAYGEAVLSASVYIEMVLQAGQQLYPNEQSMVQNILFKEPLMLAETQKTPIQLILNTTETGYAWQIFSWQAEMDEWVQHVSGELVSGELVSGELVSGELASLAEPTQQAKMSLHNIQERCQEPVELENRERRASEDDNGEPGGRWLSQIYRGHKEALGRVNLPDDIILNGYQLHPLFLDECLNVDAHVEVEDADGSHFPFHCEQVRVYTSTPLRTGWSHVRWTKEQAGTRKIDVIVFNDAGVVVAELLGMTLRFIDRESIIGASLRTDWLYRPTWIDTPLHKKKSTYDDTTGYWLFIAPLQSPMTNALATQFRQKGETVETWSCDAIAHALQTADLSAYRGIVYVPEQASAAQMSSQMTRQMTRQMTSQLASSALPDAALDIPHQLLPLVQGLINVESTQDLWLVIPDTLDASVLWGFGRALMWERPQLNTRCIEMSSETKTETLVESLFETIWYADEENQLRLGADNQRQIVRLERYQPPSTQDLSAPVQEGCSYLITGGLGQLGVRVAEWLAEQGATHLVLCSRQGSDAKNARAVVAALEAKGVQVNVIKADVSQAEDVQTLLQNSQEFAPLKGIIHAAGTLDSGVLSEQTPQRFADVFAPKVHGSWYLHQYTQEMSLDFFVAFSSQVSFLDGAGYANLASACTFMDKLMSIRQARGLPGVSINWGLWSMDALAKEVARKYGENIAPTQGLSLLGWSLSQPISQVGVSAIKWPRFSKHLSPFLRYPMLSKLLPQKSETATAVTVLHELKGMSATAQYERLDALIHAEIKHILGVAATNEQEFFSLGLDSLKSIQFTNSLAAKLETSLPVTLTLEYTTIAQLLAYLGEVVLQWTETPDPSAQPSNSQQTALIDKTLPDRTLPNRTLPEKTLIAKTLIPLQPNGSQKPFFCIPGLGNHATQLYKLGQSLGDDRPVYGFQMVGLDGQQPPLQTVEEMADFYLQCIKTVQPQGPYLLGGHSLGGKIAFEMARQLDQRGEQVSQLIAIDSAAPPYLPINIANEVELFMEVGHYMGEASGHNLGMSSDQLQNLDRAQKVSYLAARLEQAGIVAPGHDIRQIYGIVDIFDVIFHADYNPPVHTLPCPLTLIKADTAISTELDLGEDRSDPAWGWQKFSANPVVVYDAFGDHFTMLQTPHVEQLGQWLRVHLIG
ncbi:MAG: SDR family NAD(P)-dependent oxidoreductase [Chloroflexota bacterium]